MKPRMRILIVTAALVLSTGLAAPAAAVDQHSANWSMTRTVTLYYPQSSVRAAAWGALVSTNVEAAVTRFIESGFPYAKKRAALNDARNTDFCLRVLATHTAEFAPEVHAAAQYALDGGAAAREAFARTGYAAAKARDRQAREATGTQAAALEQFDRDFVVLLRDTDPGPQVRAAATYALRPAATDADLVEFFAYDWSNAAALDLEAFRIRVTDEDMRWRAGVAGLLTAAQTAEAQARELAGEAAEQARAVAARAWGEVAAQTASPRVVWADAQRVAEEQAAGWHEVAAAAGGATGLNWNVILGSAGTTAESWATEREQAAAQAAYWSDLLAEALAGQQRTTGGAA
ncbi:hypothetical protein [Paractinoplanes hotanensis]|uniref:Uncharacterized protein n=1 Tax=Paractinoplanes hotanensis TaxID=2906497 RepID=A0ABT0Y520_9ACTN|nr:hypothetical protein [Actinoplanes hotanensis]MCM4081126.1 hypothetical protein [Actinoplanes hotanensis]